MPAWDLIDAAPYRQAWTAAHGYFSMNMVSSRGCPYHCNWCAKPIWGDTYHCRSARLVAEEMLETQDALPARPPLVRRRHFRPLAALDAGVRRRGGIAGRADPVQDAIALRPDDAAHGRGHCAAPAAPRSGWAWSPATQDVLDAMDKGTRLWQIPEARENLRRHGIRACFFLQFGYPGETWAEIEKTIALVRETRPDDIGVSVSYPLPGTAFHQMVSSQLGPKENWADSDDLDMMFQGAFTTELLSCPGRRPAPRSARRPRRRGRGLDQRARAQGNLCAQAASEVTRMDLLLTHGYFLHEDPKELQIMKPYAPLGLLYLSSYLRARGVRRGDLRFHLRFARSAVPHSGDGAAGDARHLCQPDDARQCAGDPRTRRGSAAGRS